MIACGDVGGPMTSQMAGMVMPGDELVVGLGAVDGAGHSGIAFLRGEGRTATIMIYLVAESPDEAAPERERRPAGVEATPPSE